ncbi:unnamed protein product [Owenia fusiformis]|uniref:Uncharacterized protein n=1 Tax=Owenia fusiformis TaxID=6347 RepID=A0A8J1XGP3_OWEFU|nr:unnamed protein product [Owenia fusiformis]
MDKRILIEVFGRVLLICIFVYTEELTPFFREIQPEEMWLYKNPRTTSFVPSPLLWMLVALAQITIIVVGIIRKDKLDTMYALLGINLSTFLNGIVTNVIKNIVGRPRPDFFYRCFPDGIYREGMKCTGKLDVIIEGRKSFPSGHSSLAFASLGFLTWFLCGKLQPFTSVGRGQSWRLILTFFPMFLALCTALSRTCDYHHHWQDVTVGSLMGLSFSYLSYRQYYPPVSSEDCHTPYACQTLQTLHKSASSKDFNNGQKIPTSPAPQYDSYMDSASKII